MWSSDRPNVRSSFDSFQYVLNSINKARRFHGYYLGTPYGDAPIDLLSLPLRSLVYLHNELGPGAGAGRRRAPHVGQHDAADHGGRRILARSHTEGRAGEHGGGKQVSCWAIASGYVMQLSI